jgi:hypothetical protein
LLEFCRCPNQKCCAAQLRIMRQCCEAAMARANTSWTVACTPRRSKRRCETTRLLHCAFGGRRFRCGSLRLRPRPRSNSPSGERGFNGRLRRGGVRPSSRPVTSRAAATPHSMARLFLIPCDPDQALGSGRCPARLRRPARLAFRAAKLSINAEKSGFGTTTR